MPYFSVIIPTYNRAHLIVPTVESILRQEFTDFELIIVDDGSTDNTLQVVTEKFGANDQVVYLKKKNEERSVARNFGVSKARGEFVVFFDSDDEMHPYHLGTLHRAIAQQPQCNFFSTKYDIDRNGRRSESDIKNLPEGFYDYKLLLKGNPLGTLVCARRDNPNLKPFPPEFNIFEDWIFNMTNYRHDRVYIIDKVTITVNDHANRSMANNYKAIQGRQRAVEFLVDRLPFSEEELRLLRGHSDEFCAIHSYIDGERRNAMKHLGHAVKTLGWDRSLLTLMIKILIGKKLINRIASITDFSR